MRKFISSPAMALEAEQLAQDNAMASISLEEEQMLIEDAANDAVEVAADLAEADRAMDVADALEDLAVVADQISEATPTDVALVETAGALAVAGTDVEPEDVVPALEGYVGKKIATEDFRTKAEGIWKSIQAFLKQIWTKIESFFYKIFGTIPALRRRIEDMKLAVAAADKAGAVNDGKEIDLTVGVNALTVGGKPVTNEAQLTAAFKATSEAADYVFGKYMVAIAGRGEAIAKAIAAFDPVKPETSASAALAAITAHTPPALPGASKGNATRFRSYNTTDGADLLCNQHLIYKAFTENKEVSVIGAMARQSGARIEMEATQGATPASNVIKFKPLSLAGSTKLLDEALDLLKTLEEHKRGPRGNALKASKKSMESASDKAQKAMAGVKPAEGASEAVAVPYFRALLNFNGAFAHWAQSPAMQMMQTGLTSVRAVSVVVAKSVAAHKAPAAAAAAK
jgi:hypothetical protein